VWEKRKGGKLQLWRVFDVCLLAASVRVGDHPLKPVLFGSAAPQFVTEPRLEWSPINLGLNVSQREAISLSLQSRHISVIHG